MTNLAVIQEQASLKHELVGDGKNLIRSVLSFFLLPHIQQHFRFAPLISQWDDWRRTG